MSDCGCDEGFIPQADGSMAVCIQHYVPQSAKLRTSRPQPPTESDSAHAPLSALSRLFTWRSVVMDRENELDATCRYIALALSLHMNERGGSAFPSYRTLAAETRIDRTTVVRAIKRLVERGWLTLETRGGGRGKTNTYVSSIPPFHPPENAPEKRVRDNAEKGPERVRKGGTVPPPSSAPILTEDVKYIDETEPPKGAPPANGGARPPFPQEEL